VMMPIRVCSGHKSDVKEGFLHEIYITPMLRAFFTAFKHHGYAVLSRKNGICLSKDRTENYGDWQEKNDDQIIAMLREQAKNPELRAITWVYWNHRPLTHAKWVTMLGNAGFTVIERRTLAGIKALLDVQARGQSSIDAFISTPKQEVEG
jgi:hypothetical protein